MALWTANYKQQVIIATSEDETTLTPLLDGVAHQYISFSGRIVRPLPTEAEPTPQIEADEASDEAGADEDDEDEGEMMWEEKARSAVEHALENMDLDSESGVIRLIGFNEESLSADSREELERRLRSIASDAWYAYVPFDGGEAVFDCDEWGIVGNAIGPYEEQIDEFFAPGDEDENST